MVDINYEIKQVAAKDIIVGRDSLKIPNIEVYFKITDKIIDGDTVTLLIGGNGMSSDKDQMYQIKRVSI